MPVGGGKNRKSVFVTRAVGECYWCGGDLRSHRCVKGRYAGKAFDGTLTELREDEPDGRFYWGATVRLHHRPCYGEYARARQRLQATRPREEWKPGAARALFDKEQQMNFERPQHMVFSDALEAYLDEQRVTSRARSETPRDYLGASRLGVECARALWFEYTHTPKDAGSDFSGRILRIFDRGHEGEERLAKYLKEAGFELHEGPPGGGQFKVKIYKDKASGIHVIRGHADGVITSGPDMDFGGVKIGYPCLWENKIVGSKKFKEYQKSGVKKPSPEYYAQCQIYTEYLGLTNPALFTAMCADTQSVYAELIPPDSAAVQALVNRGIHIVSAPAETDTPRVAADPTDFRCRRCSYSDRCWNGAANEPTGTHTAAQAPGFFQQAAMEACKNK